MSSWREISAIGKDPVRVRNSAKGLLAAYRADLTDWELDFLDSVLQRSEQDENLTTRQAEKLVEIRDSLKHYSTIDGLSVRRLIENCWMARLDLSESDEDFINRVRGCGSLRRSDAQRLLRCARQLYLIDGYVDLDAN